MYPLTKPRPRFPAQGCFFGFALVWTGFSTFMAVMAWREGELAPFLFVLLFVLIGVLMIVGGLWRSFSKLKVGSPKLSISRTELCVGERFNLAYEQAFKQASDVGRASIELVFQEAATYTQGTDTRTDRHDHIVETFEIPGGHFEAGEVLCQSVSMEIPGDAMHTFVAENNKLQWFLRVRVDLAGWPDLKEEYEIRVLPQQIRGF